jgi:hypothetical protein
MADMVYLASLASGSEDRHTGHAARTVRRQSSPSFQHVLSAAVNSGSATRITTTAVSGVQSAASQTSLTSSGSAATRQSAATTPTQSDAALQQAMTIEGVPQSWLESLRFIMARESGGQVDIKNPVHSARGLFQLTAANYHLNPHGAQSFGNALEEAQGGIRYIQQRYGTADNAVAFWRQHHWY